MTLNLISEIISLKDGRSITIETGLLARQSDGSVVIRMGSTMILATVVASKTIKGGIDFLPLTVDYREKYSAGGKIPGGFIKREGRSSEEEILTMRIVDRLLRPLFPKDFYAEIQIMISLLSYDHEVLPDSLAGLAASAALSISDIPFHGPVSAVRIVRVNGEFIIHPSLKQVGLSDIDMIIGASQESIIMVEGSMKEISEKEMMSVIQVAHQAIKEQISTQLSLIKKIGHSYIKRSYSREEKDIKIYDKIRIFTYNKLYQTIKRSTDQYKFSANYDQIFNEIQSIFSEEEYKERESIILRYYSDIKKEAVRALLIDQDIRLDGRSSKEIRPIWSIVDYLPSVHGAAIFTRGDTQSLTTVTLGSSLDANRLDTVIQSGQEKFFLHYNFPPFSTGEIRPVRGVSRREIGHGNLAKRALQQVIPSDIPYTIRIVSDILESNGSSSMATVCAGTLALMDAGIPITSPVSGIAMGLIIDKPSGKTVILSDILGDEDYFGDMDFKIAGTEHGLTACQMDIKIESGVSYNILEQALEQAYEGRIHILKEMAKTLSCPRTSLKLTAPKIFIFEILKESIGAVIGPGGKIIQEIQSDTNTTIVIEERGNMGYVEIMGKNEENVNQALERIKYITFVPKIGNIYEVKVKSIKEFGAFVEIVPGKEYLLHISEIKWERVNRVEDVLKIGDKINVKLMGIDERNGKMKISRKVLFPNFQDMK